MSSGEQTLASCYGQDTAGELEERFLTGREEQLHLFERYLESGSGDGKHLWNVYGTAGVGKSYLLDSFRRRAQQSGSLMLVVDSRDFNHTGEQLCRQILKQLRESGAASPQADSSGVCPPDDYALEACLCALRERASRMQVIIALDTYEEMGELDGWLRERFFRQLPDTILLMLVGRYKLKEQWIASPAFRERIRFIPLGHLDITQCADYLQRSGIADEKLIERIWHKTHGHPLALSLAAFLSKQAPGWIDGSADDGEWFDHLAKVWLREVPDAELRRTVEAASVLHHVNFELLQSMMEQKLGNETFERFIALSFVRRTDRGWLMHDLMRFVMRRQLEERMPACFEQLRGRAARYYAERIRRCSAHRNIEWEVGELYYFTGSGIIRTFVHIQSRGRFAWEPLTVDNLPDGEAYLQKRRESTAPLKLHTFDPETGQRYDGFDDIADRKLTIRHLDLRALLGLGEQAVMLLKSTEGETVGLVSIIPIHKGTWSYLCGDPFAAPYIASLSPAERKQLQVEPPGRAGWFLRTIDYADWSNQDKIVEGMYLMFSYMCSGGVFISTPPPLPFFDTTHKQLGFQIAPGGTHRSYDDVTPTPMFVLDTRGEKLEQFLDFLLKQGGCDSSDGSGGSGGTRSPGGIGSTNSSVHGSRAKLASGPIGRLTEREREVAVLVVDGLTNADIAEALYVSEITIKKHVSSIFGKLAVRSRSQLIKLLMDHDGTS